MRAGPDAQFKIIIETGVLGQLWQKLHLRPIAGTLEATHLVTGAKQLAGPKSPCARFNARLKLGYGWKLPAFLARRNFGIELVDLKIFERISALFVTHFRDCRLAAEKFDQLIPIHVHICDP